MDLILRNHYIESREMCKEEDHGILAKEIKF